MDDKKEFIAFDDAVNLLPDGDMIHTFRTAGPVLIGAHHERDQLINAIRKAPKIEVTGPAAQSMGHGMAICDENGLLFIETRAVVEE